MYKLGDRIAYVHSEDMSMVDSYRDKQGHPAVATVLEARSYDVLAVVETGPRKGAYAIFFYSEIAPSMKIVSVKKGTAAKIFGKVLGEAGKIYSFGYIRNAAFRGWVCTCPHFFYDCVGTSRNCKHLHFVRNVLGRYGTEVE